MCDVAVATLLLLDCISVVARMLCRRHGHIACRRALVPVVCGVHGRRRRGYVSERPALRADRDTGRRLTLYRRARSRHRVTFHPTPCHDEDRRSDHKKVESRNVAKAKRDRKRKRERPDEEKTAADRSRAAFYLPIYRTFRLHSWRRRVGVHGSRPAAAQSQRPNEPNHRGTLTALTGIVCSS